VHRSSETIKPGSPPGAVIDLHARNRSTSVAVDGPVSTRTATDTFDRDDWWNPDGALIGLHTLLDPARVPYFLSVLRPGSRVLDVGSGGGFVAFALADAGHEVFGLDASAAAIQAADRTGAGSFVIGKGERLPFAASSFDAVVCSEVLEHVAKPAQVVSEIARVLRPGGRLVFSLPNRTHVSRLVLIDAAQRWRWSRVLPDDLHQWDRFIRPDELDRMLLRSRLQVNDISGLSVPVRSWVRTIQTMLRLKRGRIGFAEAGEAVNLRVGGGRAVAYIGHATLAVA
jgi:2-polyprenyl-6-hydroxyphenyl methylase/3-demethylubiquinone-9 3-methyltransferase